MSDPEWAVEFDTKSEIDALHRALLLADTQTSASSERVAFLVDRFAGLRVEVFAREHAPPHFRVSSGELVGTFTIKDCRPLKGGLERYHRVVQEWHQRNKALLIDSWNRLRPTDCPVGEYEDAQQGDEADEAS
jgi:Domain of unknown function (DUF4160)